LIKEDATGGGSRSLEALVVANTKPVRTACFRVMYAKKCLYKGSQTPGNAKSPTLTKKSGSFKGITTIKGEVALSGDS